jgi:uncharacterized membrane protein YheB (UPF0754 family)
MRVYLTDVVTSAELSAAFANRLADATHSDAVLARIEAVVDRRLQELTPQQVKIIVQAMIRKHLGWLVVWGGVVGGLMGLLFSAISAF